MNTLRQPTRHDWETLRPQIEQLYNVPKKPKIKDVIKILEDEHGLRITYVCKLSQPWMASEPLLLRKCRAEGSETFCVHALDKLIDQLLMRLEIVNVCLDNVRSCGT